MKKNYPSSLVKIKLLLVFTFVFSFGFSQDYTIHFQDEVVVIPENIQTFSFDQLPEYSDFNGGYYGWVQFYQTPTQSVQDNFKANNVKLIEYIPHQAYLFHFPKNLSVDFLRNNNVRGVIPVESRLKVSKELKNQNIESWAMDGSNILVSLWVYDGTEMRYAIAELAAMQIRVFEQFENSNNIYL